MLKKHACAFTSPAIYCHAYADDTYDKACVVYSYIVCAYQLAAFRIPSLQRTHLKTLCIPVRITAFQSSLIFCSLVMRQGYESMCTLTNPDYQCHEKVSAHYGHLCSWNEVARSPQLCTFYLYCVTMIILFTLEDKTYGTQLRGWGRAPPLG
jgi:hypothetical protein